MKMANDNQIQLTKRIREFLPVILSRKPQSGKRNRR